MGFSKGCSEEQPCQPEENPVLPDSFSFTQIYILFLIGFRIGPPKMHRRFRIDFPKIHRQFRIGLPKIHKRFCIGPPQVYHVSVLGRDEGYMVKYNPLPEGIPKGQARRNS